MNSAAQPSILVDDSDAYYYPSLAYARVGESTASIPHALTNSLSAAEIGTYFWLALSSCLAFGQNRFSAWDERRNCTQRETVIGLQEDSITISMETLH